MTHLGKAIGFPKQKLEKCDFFYPYPRKEMNQLYHHKLDEADYSSIKDIPTYSFGKNQSRDQASDIKNIVGILNEMKALKDKQRKERMHVHTLKEYEEEEYLKRNLNSMLPHEFQSANKSYNKNSMDISIRSKSEKIVPISISEGKKFRIDVKT